MTERPKAATIYNMFFLSGLLLLISLLNLQNSFIAFFNSDMYLLPGLFRDLFQLHAPWFFETLPPSRYIFPDLAVYSILRTIIPNYLAAYIVEIALYFAGFVSLLFVLGRKIFKSSSKQTLLVIGFICAIVTAPEIVSRGVIRGLFYPSCHAGGLLWGLFTFWIALKWIDKQTIFRSLALIFSSFLLGLSDPLEFVTILPALVLLLGAAPLENIRLRWGMPIIIAFACIAGSHLGDKLMPFTIFQFMHQQLPDASTFLSKWILFLNDLKTPFVLLGIIAGLASLIIGYSFFRRAQQRLMFIALSSIAILPVAAVILSGRYLSIDCWHYFPFTMVLALLGALGVFCAKAPRWMLLMLTVMLCGLSLIGMRFSQKYDEIVYPTLAKALQEVAPKWGLKGGLADYWAAIPVNYEVNDPSFLLPIDRFGMVAMGNSNMAHFKFPFYTDKPLTRNFIITKGINNGLLESNFGPPTQVKLLEVKSRTYQIWIYNHDLTETVIKNEYLWFTIAKRMEKDRWMMSPSVREHLLNFVQSSEILKP